MEYTFQPWIYYIEPFTKGLISKVLRTFAFDKAL